MSSIASVKYFKYTVVDLNVIVSSPAVVSLAGEMLTVADVSYIVLMVPDAVTTGYLAGPIGDTRLTDSSIGMTAYRKSMAKKVRTDKIIDAQKVFNAHCHLFDMSVEGTLAIGFDILHYWAGEGMMGKGHCWLGQHPWPQFLQGEFKTLMVYSAEITGHDSPYKLMKPYDGGMWSQSSIRFGCPQMVV